MRESRVLKKLRAGEFAFSFALKFSCAREAEFLTMFGFDCIWVDVEHVAEDWSVVEKKIWAAKLNDTDVMVRISKGSYSDYIKPLELDASGIMVPHVMSSGEAENIVRMTRFHPLGRRPVDGGNADSKYLSVSIKDYIKQANENRFVVAQIEDPEGIDNLSEIAAVPGIDMLFFGPGDYSHSLGIAGEYENPQVRKAREQVAAAAVANGKFAGTLGTCENYRELGEMGYRFMNIGADLLVLEKGISEMIETLNS